VRFLPLLVVGALATGIAAGVLWTPPAWLTLPVLVASAGATVRAVIAQDRALTALASALLAFMAAGAALGSHDERLARVPPLAEQALTGDPVGLDGVLTADASEGPNGVRIRLRPSAVNGGASTGPGEAALTVLGAEAALRLDEWRAGRSVRLTARVRRPARYRNAGVPDHQLDLARRGLVLVGSVKSALLVEPARRGSQAAEAAAAIRAHVRAVLGRRVGAIDETSAAIAIAILIGDRASLDPALEERLQAAGTYHVLAISGGNIALLTALLLTAARAAGLRGTWRTAVAAPALVAYAALVGAEPSVTRATLMALVYLLLASFDQRAWTLNTLACAAGVMLVARPLSLLDPGFVLSVGATAAIVALTSRLLARMPRRRWLMPVAAIVAASAAAELLLLPASATFFNRITVAGLALNLLAVPLMGIVQCASMVLLALDPLSDRAAGLAAWVAAQAGRGLVDSSVLVDLWPALAQRVPAPAFPVAALYVIALAGCFAGRLLDPLPGRWRARIRRSAPVLASGAALWIVLAPSTWPWPWRAGRMLTVTFLDVGQGDATLIETPRGGRWLVDAGGLPGTATFDIGARVVAPALWARGVGRLDTIVLTHGDPDHAGGAVAVLSDFRPRSVWEGVPVPTHGLLSELRERAERSGADWLEVRDGLRQDRAGLALHVWHPPPPDWERPRVRNDDSTVLELRYGDGAVVLPGDVARAVETTRARRLQPAPLRILKVAHHGSASSTHDEWLDALRPRAAVISCGRENPYNHPAPAVLARLRERGIAIYRTDEDGAVTLDTDGTVVTIRTFTGRTQQLSLKDTPHHVAGEASEAFTR